VTNFVKYPSIGKFGDVIKYVKKHNKGAFSHVEVSDDGTKTPVFLGAELPVLEFTGTVKLHGTNGAVVIDKDLNVEAQSRTRTLSLESDNYGFCQWVIANRWLFLNKYSDYVTENELKTLHIFGEWCGSNIQANVGLTGIDKTFIIFNILQTSNDGQEKWLSTEELKHLTSSKDSIYSVFDFKHYNLSIDTKDPSQGLELADKIRDGIDELCPVAKALGSNADSMNGEGNVWRCTTEGYTHLAFKHKGISHERSGKAPKAQKVEESLTEVQQEAYNTLLKEACSVDRLAQGIEFLIENNLELVHKNINVYLKWFMGDVQKECKDPIETLIKSGVAWGKVSKPLNTMAREFLISEIEKV